MNENCSRYSRENFDSITLKITRVFVKYSLLNIICEQQCNPDVSNSAVATMGFAVKNKHFITWLRVNTRSSAIADKPRDAVL